MNFLENMLFFIFPELCEMCNELANNFICEKCKKRLEKSKVYLNKIEDYSHDENKYFDKHAYIFEYNGIIREKLIKYKFYEQAYLSKMFSEFFVKNKKMYEFIKKYDIIIPVPMSKKKIRQRGYNQTKIIANIISKKIKGLDIKNNILIKCRNNQTQSKLNKIQRLKNVENVYKLINAQMIEGKNILIFDDIYTTGATCNECARTLKQAQPNKIGIITIAKELEKIQTDK